MSKCKAWWKSWETLQNLKIKQKDPNGLRSSPYLCLRDRPSLQGPQVRVCNWLCYMFNIQHSILRRLRHTVTYCDLLRFSPASTSTAWQKRHCEVQSMSSLGCLVRILFEKKSKGWYSSSPRKLMKANHTCQQNKYIYIYRYIFAWRREDPESTSC
jgi:hypothetical protein